MLPLVGGHNVQVDMLNMPALGFIEPEQAPTYQSEVKFSYWLKSRGEDFSKGAFIWDSVGGLLDFRWARWTHPRATIDFNKQK